MDWESWKQEYGGFSEAEDAEKKRAWEATLAYVTAHNEKYEQGLVSYQLAMNKFAVQSPPLMSSPGEMVADSTAPPTEEEVLQAADFKLPRYFNHKNIGFVTSVKDQGQCGSCYAFAAVGVLEAQNRRANGKLVSLSAQQLVDCSDNNGCNGGNPSVCFEYAKNGLATSDDYPYRGKKGPCQLNKAAEVKVASTLWADKENSLFATLLFDGPTAVGIHIPRSFHFIKNDTDVFDSQEPGEGWHAVLVVGYGTTTRGVPYWIIKNSWGTDWGGGGYALLKRGVNLFQIGDYGCFARVVRNKQTSEAETDPVEI